MTTQQHAHSSTQHRPGRNRPAPGHRRPRRRWLVTLALAAVACGGVGERHGHRPAPGRAATTGTPATRARPVDGGAPGRRHRRRDQRLEPGPGPVGRRRQPRRLVGARAARRPSGADHGAKPWLADSWIANDTFDSWLIQLHPDVTFQNGEEFDADVGQAEHRLLRRPARCRSIALEAMIKDVEVVDALTVQVNLTQPWAAFPSSFLTGSPPYMMAPAMLDSADHGRAHPIGTGPFTFDSWAARHVVQGEEEPELLAGRPARTSTRSSSGSSPTTTSRAAALQSGDVNMMLTTQRRGRQRPGRHLHGGQGLDAPRTRSS